MSETWAHRERVGAQEPHAVARADARTHAYRLLAAVFRTGIDAPTADALGHPGADDPDGVVFTRLFMLELPPQAGVFLHPDGLLDGDGFLGADGLAGELDALAEGPVDGGEALDGRLLRWLPAFVVALDAVAMDDAEAAPYRTAGRLVLDLALDHRRQFERVPPAWALPAVAPLLDAPDTGLWRIASTWAVASRTGGYLAPATLRRLARELDLPAGFGSRADRIEGLLRSAAHYGRVPALMDAVDAEMARWDAGHAAFEARGGFGGPWRARIAETRAALATVASAAERGPSANPS